MENFQKQTRFDRNGPIPGGSDEIRALGIGFRGAHDSRPGCTGTARTAFWPMNVFLALFLILWAMAGLEIAFLYCGIVFWAIIILADSLARPNV